MTSTSSVRQRGGQTPKKGYNPGSSSAGELGVLPKGTDLNSTIRSEWGYRIALAIITALAFVTRFWGIGHPNEVVFDEVHFGKVGSP